MLITLGCEEACPVVPGLVPLDWQIEDPKERPTETVREIRDEIRERVMELLEEKGWRATG